MDHKEDQKVLRKISVILEGLPGVFDGDPGNLEEVSEKIGI